MPFYHTFYDRQVTSVHNQLTIAPFQQHSMYIILDHISQISASVVLSSADCNLMCIAGWLGSQVAKALDLQLAGCEFNSRPGAVD